MRAGELVASLQLFEQQLSKVVVLSVFQEWWTKNGSFTPPAWVVDPDLQKRFNYTVFVYQKVHPNRHNYISTNRGRENGPFYRYIVENYDNFRCGNICAC